MLGSLFLDHDAAYLYLYPFIIIDFNNICECTVLTYLGTLSLLGTVAIGQLGRAGGTTPSGPRMCGRWQMWKKWGPSKVRQSAARMNQTGIRHNTCGCFGGALHLRKTEKNKHFEKELIKYFSYPVSAAYIHFSPLPACLICSFFFIFTYFLSFFFLSCFLPSFQPTICPATLLCISFFCCCFIHLYIHYLIFFFFLFRILCFFLSLFFLLFFLSFFTALFICYNI